MYVSCFMLDVMLTVVTATRHWSAEARPTTDSSCCIWKGILRRTCNMLYVDKAEIIVVDIGVSLERIVTILYSLVHENRI